MNSNLIIDTDMGDDDIIAIMMIIRSGIKISGITTVSGVSSVSLGAKNLTRIFNSFKFKTQIIQGHSNYLSRSTAAFPVHDISRAENLTLLKNIVLPKVKYKASGTNAEDYLFQKSQEYSLSILALGPLTNLANTILKYKEKFTSRISSITVMGGGIQSGNVPPENKVEYNIARDPLAARIVFESDIPITMVGVDATSKVPCTESFVNQLRKIKPATQECKILKEIIINNEKDFVQFYDPLASGIFINKKIISNSIKSEIDVLSSGQTVLYIQRNNVEVITDVNKKRFYSMLLTYIGGSYND